MPTYVYKFIDTDETIEVQQAFTEDALTQAVHPETGTKMRVKKVFLPVGVTFRGDGFYKTDSRGGKGAKKSSSSDSGSDKSSGDKSSGDKSSGDKSSGDKSSDGAGDKSSSSSSTSDSSGSKATAASAPAASSATKTD